MSSHNSWQIFPKQPEVYLESDASKLWQGEAHCLERNGALWSLQGQQAHSNVLEIQAAIFATQTFLKTRRDIHVLIHQDNRMGGNVSSSMSTSSRTMGMVFNSENYSVCKKPKTLTRQFQHQS